MVSSSSDSSESINVVIYPCLCPLPCHRDIIATATAASKRLVWGVYLHHLCHPAEDFLGVNFLHSPQAHDVHLGDIALVPWVGIFWPPSCWLAKLVFVSPSGTTKPSVGILKWSASRVISLTWRVRQWMMHWCLLVECFFLPEWAPVMSTTFVGFVPMPLQMRSFPGMCGGESTLFGVYQHYTHHWRTSCLIPSSISH